jgi:glycosyltransferase involved in cell wall biosynthesis
MYILVTPAKNEAQYLPEVASSVINQTLRPVLWLIVDDGSADQTPQIIENLKNQHSWIQSIRLGPRARDITFGYSFVCKKGFDHIIEYCKLNKITYEYIALLDADSVLEPDYFRKMTDEFEKDSELGIFSGGIYHNVDGKLKRSRSSPDLPAGTGRIWRLKCFLDTGGYPVEPSPDSISNVKAFLRGWKIKKNINVVLIEKRFTGSAEGLWKGYRANGYMAYYLNKHPLLMFLNMLNYLSMYPFYPGLAFFYGYLISSIKRVPKIKDDEIKNYYGNRRIKDLIKNIHKSTKST